MKKLLIAFALLFGAMFVSCGSNKDCKCDSCKCDSCEYCVDTVMIDTTDTIL